jgi:pyrroloquinoline-quinone synthase
LVDRNLNDELGTPEPHLALFDRFARSVSVGGDPSVPGGAVEGPAAASLVETYRDLLEHSPVAALAGLAAYESQASEIASSKADGLRRWYGIDAAGVEFWDLHAELDSAHGDWAVTALELLHASPKEVTESARRAADAWWSLLDERQDAYLASAA